MPPEPLVPRETRERLDCFLGILRQWNPTIRLVSPRDIDVLWDRHVLDSLQLLPHLPRNLTRAIDIGSGGGFPGLVLAIASGRRFDLIEADQRKAAFLCEAARRTGADVGVHAARCEDLAVPPAELVTARALAPLPRLLEWVAPLLSRTGVALLLKGRNVARELTEAAVGWHMRVDRVPSVTDDSSWLVKLHDIRRR